MSFIGCLLMFHRSFARILEFFDRSEHGFIRSSLANSLKAIMVQRLPAAKGIADDEAEENWRRAVILMSSLTADELLDPDTLYHPPDREGIARDLNDQLRRIPTSDLRPGGVDLAEAASYLAEACSASNPLLNLTLTHFCIQMLNTWA